MNLLNRIDSTNLKVMASEADIRKLCRDAIKFKFRGVCVHPKWVKYASQVLADNLSLELVTVVGFPLGCNTTDIKIREAERAQRDGATEIDVVWNPEAFREHHYLQVIEEIVKIRDAVPVLGVKVIVEVTNIHEKDWGVALSVVIDSGAPCIKTSTGIARDMDLLPVIKCWKRPCGGFKIKAAGGIHEAEYATALLEAGADILGTSSGEHFARYVLGDDVAFPEDLTCL